MAAGPPRPVRTAGPGWVIGCAVVLAIGLLSGCTGDDESESGPTTTATSRPTAPPTTESVRGGGSVAELRVDRAPAPQTTIVRRVWGRWPAADDAPRTRRLVEQTGRAVRTWLDRGFVEVAYPSRRFDGAFADFTPGAAALARRQASLTTNRSLGTRLVDVVATRRVVRVTAFAPRGTAVGATADVTLVLQGVGEAGRRNETVVLAELSLTRTNGRWKVFGYDVQRSVGPPGTFAEANRRAGGSGGDR